MTALVCAAVVLYFLFRLVCAVFNRRIKRGGLYMLGEFPSRRSRVVSIVISGVVVLVFGVGGFGVARADAGAKTVTETCRVAGFHYKYDRKLQQVVQEVVDADVCGTLEWGLPSFSSAVAPELTVGQYYRFVVVERPGLFGPEVPMIVSATLTEG